MKRVRTVFQTLGALACLGIATLALSACRAVVVTPEPVVVQRAPVLVAPSPVVIREPPVVVLRPERAKKHVKHRRHHDDD